MTPFTIFMVTVSIILIIIILIQQKSSALGSMAGQDAGEEIAQTRRGAEKLMHQMTILLLLVFMGGAIYKMLF
jgi:protein translocase SecG subunit